MSSCGINILQLVLKPSPTVVNNTQQLRELFPVDHQLVELSSRRVVGGLVRF